MVKGVVFGERWNVKGERWKRWKVKGECWKVKVDGESEGDGEGEGEGEVKFSEVNWGAVKCSESW